MRVAAIDLTGYVGLWVKIASYVNFSENSVKLFVVIRIPKMYSLTHLRCLVFKLHKVIDHVISNLYRGFGTVFKLVYDMTPIC